MEIKTKFKIGDSVWSILEGRAHGFEIKSITICQDSQGNTRIGYSDNNYHTYPAHQCFLTKEELRDYFMSGE